MVNPRLIFAFEWEGGFVHISASKALSVHVNTSQLVDEHKLRFCFV